MAWRTVWFPLPTTVILPLSNRRHDASVHLLRTTVLKKETRDETCAKRGGGVVRGFVGLGCCRRRQAGGGSEKGGGQAAELRDRTAGAGLQDPGRGGQGNRSGRAVGQG